MERPDGSGTPEFLMSARKRKKSKNANYQITASRNAKAKDHVVGKVRYVDFSLKKVIRVRRATD